MFGISMPELIVVLIAAFLVVGPKRIAGSSEDIGRVVKRLREKLTHFRQTVIQEEVDLSSFFNPDIDLNKSLGELSKVPNANLPTGKIKEDNT